MPSSFDREIDRLYQLPLNEFTKARDALAKDHPDQRADIKQLQKPNAPAWAVNQLYWRERGTYEALVAAAEKLRKAQMASLTGKSADVPAAEAAHANARRSATERVRKMLDEAGDAASPATLTAITETLDALPVDAPPGRLVKPLKPAARPTPAEERQEKHKAEKALKELTAKARDAAAADKEAAAALTRAKSALEKARKAQVQAEQDLADATERVGALERQLREADRKASQTALARATAERELDAAALFDAQKQRR